MKTLIQIPGDGNCLFNAILIGYVDSHHGQYPNINGLEIKTQEQLRNAVQKHYLKILSGNNHQLRQELLERLRNEISDAILLNNFQGFYTNNELLLQLEAIRVQLDNETDEALRSIILLESINEYLIFDYVLSLSSIWGGEQEIHTLRNLLDTNIRLSGHGNPQGNEIEINYVGGNHYNVYIDNSDNEQLLDVITVIGGEIISRERSLLTESQIFKISTFNDYKFHLFLQVIYNKREAEQRDIDISITDEEVNYAIMFIDSIKKTNVIEESKSDDSYSEDNPKEMSPIKPKNWSLLFRDQNKESLASNRKKTKEEKYQLYYDDTSSEEEDEKALEVSRLKDIRSKTKKLKKKISKIDELNKEKAEKLKDKIKKEKNLSKEKVKGLQVTIKALEEFDIEAEDLELSFLAHEFGIRILASPEVYKHYYSFKDKHLGKNTVLTDEQISKLLKSAFKAAIKKSYKDTHQSLIDKNTGALDELLDIILQDKRAFIKAIRENTVIEIFQDVIKSLDLPSETKVHSGDELAELVIEIHAEIGEKLTPNPGDIKSAYLKVSNKHSRPELTKYTSKSPLKMKLAKELKSTSKRTIKTFLEDLPEDIKREKIKLTDIFMSNLEIELLNALNIMGKDKVYRETLPSHFDISFNSEEEYDITQFLAYIRLLKLSNIRLIKNYRDNTNILNDDVETLSRSFSLLGLDSGGLESQEVSKKTGTRSDIVGIGKADGSTSYAAIAKILSNKSSYLGITDAEIANWIIDVLEGSGNEFISKLEINRFQKEMLEKFINSLTYLMFSTEVARSPASLIINYMILELISEECLSWEDVFEERQMPMSITDAVKTSRWMHANYDTTIRYSYDKTTSSLSNDNGEKDMKILEDIINKEAAIFKLWLSLNGLEYEGEISSSEAIALLAQKCSQWYGVTVLSKSLIIDLLADLYEKEAEDMEDVFNQLEHEELENLLEIASNEDTKVVLSWYFEEDIEGLYNNIIEQIANLGSSELKRLAIMVRRDDWEERKLIYKLLDTGLELSKAINILKNAIDHLDRSSEADFGLNEFISLDSDQLEQLDEMISEDTNFLLKLNTDIALEELLRIHSDYSDDQEKLEALLDSEFLLLRAEYKRVTKDSISLESFYKLYEGNESKLRFLLDNEYKHNLIKRTDYNTVSEAFDEVCTDEGIDQDHLFDVDEEEIDIYQLIYDKLESSDIINSDEEISVNFCLIKYDNEILNHPKGQKLFELAAKSKNLKAINLLLELGKDKFFAEQIILMIDDLGEQKLLETLFDSNPEVIQRNSNINQELEFITKSQDEQTLESISKIEEIIGKEALYQIIGFSKYVYNAFSNGPYSKFSSNIINSVSSLMENLQDALDMSSLYESIFLDDQVAILLTQIDYLFDFIASGPIAVGFPPRPPYFDPDDYYGGFGNGESNINNTDFEMNNIPLYIGVNTTSFDI